MFRTVCTTLVLTLVLMLRATAPVAAAEILPGRGIADLGPHLVYATDPAADLATMLERYRAGAFGPKMVLNQLATNFSPETWAATDLVNASFDDGRPPDPFVVTLALPMASGAHFYLVRENGLTEALLAYNLFNPYDATDHSVTRLQTQSFTLAPGERATLIVKIFLGPFKSFRMALETPEELQASAFTDGVSITAFYVFSLACMMFFVAFFLAFRDWISLHYAMEFLIFLALIAYIDGLLFRFFYPDHPEWQSVIGFGLLCGLPASGFALSAYALAGVRPGWARVCMGLAAVSVAVFVSSLGAPGTYAAVIAYVLNALAAIALLVSNESWRARHGGTHFVAKAMGAIATVATAVIVLLLTTGWGQGVVQVPQALKAIYIVLLITTITNFAALILHIRRQHAAALVEKIAALEAEARRSQELLASEQAYSRARDLARTRQRQLATASHDFRQPLASLRMTLDGLGAQMDPDLRARMRKAFDYMEKLSGDYLTEAIVTGDDAPVSDPDPETPEAYPLSLIVETVWQMFHDEAVSKGLRLRRVPSEILTEVPPMILMRIVSNLVSNAVKYTEAGGVLAGIRHRPGGPEIWVCDTGPGMSEAEIAIFRQEGRKGAVSKGHGLGLAVCFGLADKHGLALTVRSEPGRGTVFALRLPDQPS